MAARAQLASLLTGPLAHDAGAADAGTFVAEVLRLSDLVARVEAEGENGAPVLHRLALRITGLLSTSKDALARAAGLLLALEATRQSQAQLLSHGKGWFNSALSMLARPNDSAPAHLAAIALVEAVFVRAAQLRLAEFAREVASPAAARSYADCLLALVAKSADASTRARALAALATLIGLHASPLRPLATALQAQSSALLFDAEPAVAQSAGSLLARVFLTAGKAQAGASWKRTVEGLCAGIDQSLVSVTTTFNLPDPIALAPLDLPPMQPASTPSEHAASLASRIATLVETVITMLCSSTERPVAIPVGVLVRICTRLFTLNAVDGGREHVDPTIRLAELAVLPQLHVVACKLAAQIGITIGHELARHLTSLTGTMTRALDTTPTSSPVQGSIVAAYSFLVESAPLDPDDPSQSLQLFVQSIVLDVSRLVKSSAQQAPKAVEKEVVGQGRKAKRRKVFETDSAFAPTAQLADADVVAAERALSSFSRILASPASAYIAAGQLNQLMRLLLAVALDPAFAAACATPGVAISSSPLEAALAQHPSLRTAVLDALVRSIPLAGRDAAGLVERVVGVFESAARSIDAEVREVATRGIATLDLCLHPRVPPLLRASKKQLVAEAYAEPRERTPSPEPEPMQAAPAPEPAPAPVASTQLDVPPASIAQPAPPSPPPIRPVETVPVVEAPVLPTRPPPAPLASTSAPKPVAGTSQVKAPEAMMADDDDEPLPTINLGFTDDESDDEAMAS